MGVVIGDGLGVVGGTDEADLFEVVEGEADGAGVLGGAEGAGHFEEAGDAGAVVIGAGGVGDGIEVGGDEDDLVGKGGAGEIKQDVVVFGGGGVVAVGAGAVGDGLEGGGESEGFDFGFEERLCGEQAFDVFFTDRGAFDGELADDRHEAVFVD